MFQYHTGPIKSVVVHAHLLSPGRFQYHTGPIKSEADPTYAATLTTSFNTTLVQLKGGSLPMHGTTLEL